MKAQIIRVDFRPEKRSVTPPPTVLRTIDYFILGGFLILWMLWNGRVL